MQSVGLRDLKQRTSEIVRRVEQNGVSVQITRHGRPVARIVPMPPLPAEVGEAATVWDEMDRLALELARRWPDGLAGADATAELRREL